MRTLHFTFNIGVNPGYGHNNECQNPVDVVAKIWHEEAAKLNAAHDFYVSGVASFCKTIYHVDWGCPVGGEDTVHVTGVQHPEFMKDRELWVENVKKLCIIVGKRLNQSTGYLHFTEVDFHYLKFGEL